MESVTFRNKDLDIAADLYLPDGFDPSLTYPAVVSAHPIGSCKEQTSGQVYGAGLAAQGYVVLAFDASFQGASGGEPRFVEDPGLRVEDFRCAVDYLVTLGYVDEHRIGVLGICGGGGYAVTAAMTDRRFKAVGTVAAVNFGRMMREGDLSPDAAIATLDAVAAQRTAEARGADPVVGDALPASPEKAAELGITGLDVVEATKYYRTSRGRQPNGLTRSLFSHMGPALGYDAFHLADQLLTQPLQIVVGGVPGEFGSYRDGFDLFHRARSQHKDILVVPGESHYDLYWKPEATGRALDALIPFYNKYL
ncbi:MULTISPECIES: alpha/beta hydrolase [Streptomyces]|uniref:Alpha/beta hydrolase n=1 Tax=Streptomyces tsukubensis (strain DSM 42081 / NBRC 108919 / NRRL 18488 / 9993) TaxID=1114943 RepID=I2N8B8_STRT9|nr:MULTISPECIES: alpha/beta hydrolase [Streptomyces]AZK97173.1 alpha/beta hydrolase [Streptomyces tsukubensis]EIF93265.1 alpha/beta hydrolase [Streptomyces tsukubensis NRRL18488]MYS68184.1 prolyl oligopeptidase family serine peptidase [Streptomyces sp. SID5473]QKM66859.1 alpha/beta hydrolase [Streptomyces tsukubensis NRRL18488]TAI44794.1 alpha/beta hydrolase [Streptomyces tsukubensis]